MGEPDVSVLSSGEAESPQMDLFDAKVRATIRYADPAAWTAATAIARSLSGRNDCTGTAAHDVGLILVSDSGPAEAMDFVAALALEGNGSPLRYPAANPGSMAGVSCIAFGFRGPTLNLTMLPQHGMNVAFAAGAGWLARGSARQVLVAAVSPRGEKHFRARAVLLGPASSEKGQAGSMARWMAEAG